MIALPEYLEKPFLHMTECEHKSADNLLAQLVEEYPEDYQDIQLAEKAINKIESGESTVLSLADAKKLYDELVH